MEFVQVTKINKYSTVIVFTFENNRDEETDQQQVLSSSHGDSSLSPETVCIYFSRTSNKWEEQKLHTASEWSVFITWRDRSSTKSLKGGMVFKTWKFTVKVTFNMGNTSNLNEHDNAWYDQITPHVCDSTRTLSISLGIMWNIKKYFEMSMCIHIFHFALNPQPLPSENSLIRYTCEQSAQLHLL